jgi:prolyl-tRNA synthetase
MRTSRLFVQTQRETPADAEVMSHQLLVKAGYIKRLTSGVYSYLPLMWRVLQKISAIVSHEMDAAGAQQLHLPVLQPAELWQETGRWDRFVQDGLLMHFNDRHDRPLALGPTHEEVITDVARQQLKSYRQLPTHLYQIQTKFRDEPRPRFGLLRGREFIMKDGYSFHASQACLDNEYDVMAQTYYRIFERCGLQSLMVQSDSGAIGGAVSHEFMVLTHNQPDAQQSGENDVIFAQDAAGKVVYAANIEKAKVSDLYIDSDGTSYPLQLAKGIEVGNIFQLGTKYSVAMKATFTDEDGSEKPYIMGCYGLGVSRVAAAAVEQHHDANGLCWPVAIAPYHLVIVPANVKDDAQREAAETLYAEALKAGLEVVLDDRDERAGVKFKDADLIGYPLRITVGKSLATGQIEVKPRRATEPTLLGTAQAITWVTQWLTQQQQA